MKRISVLIVMAIALLVSSFGSAAANQIYYVQAGDSLFNIAWSYGVTVEEIVEANSLLNPNAIYAGQALVIPDGQDDAVQERDPSQTQLYSVQPGDTMYRIAVNWGITVDELIAANPAANPAYIYVGQQLVVPVAPPVTTEPENPSMPTAIEPVNDGTAEPVAADESEGSEDSAETPITEPVSLISPSPEPLVHIVAFGDTLTGIADFYGVNMYDIMDANGLTNPNWLYVGQALVIPGIPAPTAEPVAQPPAESPAADAPAEEAPAAEAPPAEAPVAEAPAEEKPFDINAGSPVGANLLPNPSFEEGHYNAGGLAELQVPNGWKITWEEGPNEFDHDYLRPETRVLSKEFLPPNEHDMFIYDGNYTVKVFKGYAPISFNMLSDVTLEPGVYELQVSIFPDLVTDYADGNKNYANDGLAGEIRLFGGDSISIWQPLTKIGERNIVIYRFVVEQTGTYIVGANMRGRYGLLNNGFFMDNWILQAVQQ